MFRRIAAKLLMRAAGAETFAAQHGPTARRFEGNGIRLAALIADNLKTLAFAATAATRTAAEISAARVSASLATLRLAQIALGIILLFSLCERKLLSAFGAGNLNVWHGSFFLLEKARPVRALLSSFALRTAV
jgi:hypothetical protein